MRGYALINFILLLISPAAYAYGKAFSYLFIAVSWVALYPAEIFLFKMDPLGAALSIVIFNLLIFGSFSAKRSLDKSKREYVIRLRKSEDAINGFKNELEKLKISENLVREKELAVVRLYEMTRKMSGSLKFDAIFDIFSGMLKDNFKFRSCELIIQKESGADLKSEKRYIVSGENKINEAGLSNVNSGARPITSIPLLSENKLLGTLVIEDLPAEDIERAKIVSMQFALEMKKVILYEKLEELAITDGLTGLYVRRYFLERLDEESQRSKRYKFNFAFLMIDIDNFKKCNDTYGHLVGDVILREVGRIIKEHVREIDLASRYGGEEFALVLPETGMEGAIHAGERIRKHVEENIFRAYDEKLKLTVSVGVAVYPEDSDNAREIIEKADEALYVAKKSGKNVVCEHKR